MNKQHTIAVATALASAAAMQYHVLLAAGIVCLGVSALVLYPAHERMKREQAMEAAIAREASWIANELAVFPLEQVLSMHAHGALKDELDTITRKSARGIPLRIALEQAGKQATSKHIKRCFELLRFAAAHAPPREELEELSREIASANEARAQAYASKLSFYGVALITVSAILPALAAAYFLLGSGFLHVAYADDVILAVFLLAFPLADVALLAYVHELAPVVS